MPSLLLVRTLAFPPLAVSIVAETFVLRPTAVLGGTAKSAVTLLALRRLDAAVVAAAGERADDLLHEGAPDAHEVP